MIFVSVAAYRDPQLPLTIRDCLDKARHPDQLRFCIGWQHGREEQLPGWLSGRQFKLIDIPFQESRGACWVRALNMDMWDGEEWYLQLDSHHRFVPDWDLALLEQAAATGSAKPVLSTYGAVFSPGEVDGIPTHATKIALTRFAPEGDILTGPQWLPEDSARPVRARFVSAHFLFAEGSFAERVPYDPDLYFLGEETTLAVRAFTHGYDLFHPGVPILSHEYSRAGRRKHWDDHRAENGAAVEWHQRDAVSREKVRRLLTERTVGHYGLGSLRTLGEYEDYAGISFEQRRVRASTLRGEEPPNPRNADDRPDDWVEA